MSRFSFIVVNAKFSRIVRKMIDLVGFLVHNFKMKRHIDTGKQLSNISEKRHPLESFVGRMMNHQTELMTWRGELAAHLAPQYGPGSEQRPQSGSPWAQRQCFDLELRMFSYDRGSHVREIIKYFF